MGLADCISSLCLYIERSGKLDRRTYNPQRKSMLTSRIILFLVVQFLSAVVQKKEHHCSLVKILTLQTHTTVDISTLPGLLQTVTPDSNWIGKITEPSVAWARIALSNSQMFHWPMYACNGWFYKVPDTKNKQKQTHVGGNGRWACVLTEFGMKE